MSLYSNIEEQEDILKRLVRLAEFAPYHSSSFGQLNPSPGFGSYNTRSNSFARELAASASPIESLLRSSPYKVQSLESTLGSTSKPTQTSSIYLVNGTDGANLTNTSTNPSNTFTVYGSGINSRASQGPYTLGTSTYGSSQGLYGPKGSAYSSSYGSGKGGGYAGGKGGGPSVGSGSSASSSSSSSSSSGGSSGGSGGGSGGGGGGSGGGS